MSTPRADWPRRIAITATGAFTAIPIVRMISAVHSSGRMQYGDYWAMVATIFRPDGGIDLGGLFRFQNQHPVVIAKLLYWFNYKLTAGSNVSLGYIVTIITVLQVMIIASMIRQTKPLGRWHKAALIAGSSALLFAPFGAWNFVRAMSGAAWLTANLFGLGAIAVRSRRGRLWPLPLGILASVSYGTGLAIWPALLLTGWTRDRRLRAQWPTMATAVLTAAWYLHTYLNLKSSSQPRAGLFRIAKNTLKVIGTIVTPDHPSVATWLGGAVIAVIIASATALLIRGRSDAAPWFGVAAFGLFSVALIGLERSGGYFENLVQSRYSSPAAIVWIGALALVSTTFPLRIIGAVPVVALAITTGVTGTHTMDVVRNSQVSEDLAIAMHLDLADGSRYYGVFIDFPDVTGLLRSIHHYPFDGRWKEDCGLLGQRLAPDLIASRPNGRSRGSVLQVSSPSPLKGGTRFSGRINSGSKVDCLLVVNHQDKVVGVGLERPESHGQTGSLFSALARNDQSPTAVIVRFKGEPRFERLPAS